MTPQETLALMTAPFVLKAMGASAVSAAAAGPLGCFVIWRRMAYFGDSLSHTALLGVALGLLTGLNVQLCALCICAMFAFLLIKMRGRGAPSSDTLLGVLAHGSLALGVTLASLSKETPFDPEAMLFGDVLSADKTDLILLGLCAALTLGMLARYREDLLLMTLNEDLAGAEGVRTAALDAAFVGLVTLATAASLRVTGALLFASLLVIPAAAAKRFASSPEGMAVIASGFGILAAFTGVAASAIWDVPPAPAAASAAAALFIVTSLLPSDGTSFRRRS